MEDAHEIFVPGRVCLMGEHSDWAGGFRRLNPSLSIGKTLVCGTNEGLFASVTKSSRVVLQSAAAPADAASVDWSLDKDELLMRARNGGFWSYCAGVAYLMTTYYDVGGLEVNIHRVTLPVKKGLSSSAACCVLIVRAYSCVYGLKLTQRGEMELAYQAEVLTPSKCGRMDQACAFGSQPVAITYDADHLEVAPLQVGAALHYVIVDLAGHKDTVTILSQLQSGFPFPETAEQRAVVDMLGEHNLRIVGQAMAAIQNGDLVTLGRCMDEAQSLMDSAGGAVCPSELTAPLLHRCILDVDLRKHILGGKQVGAGGDGTAQLLCATPADQARALEIVERKLGMTAFVLTIPPTVR